MHFLYNFSYHIIIVRYFDFPFREPTCRLTIVVPSIHRLLQQLNLYLNVSFIESNISLHEMNVLALNLLKPSAISIAIYGNIDKVDFSVSLQTI